MSILNEIYHKEKFMKKLFSIFLSVIVVAASLSFSASVSAADSYYDTVKSGKNSDGYYVIKADSVDDLFDAFDTAKNKASSSLPYKIVVKPGTYRLKTALKFYNNTYLYARGAKFYRVSGSTANMVRCGLTSDNHTGYYFKNLTVDGGTWDEENGVNTLMKFAHAKNVVIKNATFQNVKAHIIEIAGVDGLTIDRCKFSNQSLNGNSKTYESIQLDILEKKHFKQYKYQDLSIKNVTVNKCTFTNVPRAIGSHTAVLNNPITNIKITNNTFNKMKSCAVQLLYVRGCTISGNTVTASPRGISVFGGVFSGQDTFLASTLAKQGGVTTKTSSKYVKPSDMKIVIKNNKISLSGTDAYAKYDTGGIWLNGYNASKAYKSGDSLPKGNYYVTGVTISGNTVSGNGQGIRLDDVRNASVSGNKLTFKGKVKKVNFYGINIRNGCKSVTAKKNTISGGYVNGIYVQSASAGKITDNKITACKKYGISIEKSTASNILSNTVSKCNINGIHIWDKSTVKNIQKNKVSSCKKRGIYVGGKSKVTNITGNSLKSCKQKIFINKDSKVKKAQKK